MKPYRIPNHKNETEWISCLVLSYKTIKGFEFDDRDWDKVHWSRTARSAKLLLSVCKDLRTADTCLTDLRDKFEQDNLTWTLETVVRHSTDWMLEKRGRNDNRSRQRFFDAIARRRTEELGAQNGKLTPAKQILDSFRDLPEIPEFTEEDSIRNRGAVDVPLLGPILEDETD